MTKLCAYLRPKLHPVLLDAAINSPSTVRLNLYQMAWLAGAKFSCLVQALCSARPAGSRQASPPLMACGWPARPCHDSMKACPRLCSLRSQWCNSAVGNDGTVPASL